MLLGLHCVSGGPSHELELAVGKTQEIGRRHTGDESRHKYVSRAQAFLRWTGTQLILGSVGVQPTGVQPSDKTSRLWLAKGEEAALPLGALILMPGTARERDDGTIFSVQPPAPHRA